MKKIYGMVTTGTSSTYTPYALRSFFNETPIEEGDRFILIDNDGGFDATEWRGRDNFEVIKNIAPKSFASNMNRVINEALVMNADVYLLNNDLVFGAGWSPPLAAGPEAIVCASSNMQWNYVVGQLQFKITMQLSDYLGQESSFRELVHHHHREKRGYRLHHAFPFYCVRIPLAILQSVGLFDESYGMAGWEDTDYTLRTWLKGFPLVFSLDSLVLHFYGKSTWTADNSPDQISTSAEANKIGEKLFRERWGDELAEIFGIQNEQGRALLQRYEEEILTREYAVLISRLAGKSSVI